MGGLLALQAKDLDAFPCSNRFHLTAQIRARSFLSSSLAQSFQLQTPLLAHVILNVKLANVSSTNTNSLARECVRILSPALFPYPEYASPCPAVSLLCSHSPLASVKGFRDEIQDPAA
jgi:hypothetical protein